MFAVLFLAMLAITALFLQDTLSFLARAVATTGTVVELQRVVAADPAPAVSPVTHALDSHNSVVFVPIVHFKFPDGSTGKFTGTGSNPARFGQGQVVEVLYDPTGIQDPRIKGNLDMWGRMIVLLPGWILILAGGCFIIADAMRSHHEAFLKTHPEQAEAAYARSQAWRLAGDTVFKFSLGLMSIVIMVVLVMWLQSIASFVLHASRSAGTVVHLYQRGSDARDYAAVVRYRGPGGESLLVESKTTSNPPIYAVGENVEVLFDPANPYDARINGFTDFWLWPLLMSVIGGTFFLGGLAMIAQAWKDLRKGHDDEYLKALGTPIETDFLRVELDAATKVNGKSPFRVISQWRDPATAKTHMFRSNPLWWDPTKYMKSKVAVLIDGHNPAKYYMDVFPAHKD